MERSIEIFPYVLIRKARLLKDVSEFLMVNLQVDEF